MEESFDASVDRCFIIQEVGSTRKVKCGHGGMIVHFLEGYKGSGGEGISLMSVMLVSYEQGAKGDKRVSYYNTTL